MQRILFVMPYFIRDGRGGGAEVQAYIKARYLASRGRDVIYLTSRPEGAPEEEVVEGIRVIRKLRMPFPLRNTLTIFREILRLRPCIVYTRMNWPALLPAGIASKIISARTVWFATEDATLHHWFNLRSTMDAARGYEKSKLKIPLLIANAFLEDLFFNLGLRLTDHVFAQNEFQRRMLKDRFGMEARLFKSVQEIPETHPEKSPVPMILWAGNFGRRKRPEIFVEIARRMPQYDFVMIGKAKGTHKNMLKDAPPNLRYAGYVPFEESEAFFERAWLYVNTSEEGREGFPNTFIQAWKHRTAVVSMNADPDGLLSQKGLGILTGDSVDRLVEAIRRLVENEELRARITERAYDYVREHHDVRNLLLLRELSECPSR